MRVTRESEMALSLIRSKEPIIVYDLETTGLSPKSANIIQFSGDLYSCKATGKYEKEDSLNIYICQDMPLPAKIVELTGITDGKLAIEGISEGLAAYKIRAFFERAKIISGYNNKKFDDAFIDKLFLKYYNMPFVPEKEIDVFAIAKELIDVDDLCEPHYKLCNIADYYKVTQEGFHNAAVDIDNTWRVFKCEMQDYMAQKKGKKKLVSEFDIRQMHRWKKSRKMDRMYVYTTKGKAVYDLYTNEIKSDNELDPNVLLEKMQVFAKSMGFSSVQAFSLA